MPNISDLAFSITSRDFANVVLDVSFSVQRTALERFLGEHGLEFEERIWIMADDPGVASDQVMHTFTSQLIAFAPGELVATRARQVTVPPRADQLFARVEVRYVGIGTPRATADSAISTTTVV